MYDELVHATNWQNISILGYLNSSVPSAIAAFEYFSCPGQIYGSFCFSWQIFLGPNADRASENENLISC